MNEWVVESLKEKGITIFPDGSMLIAFNGKKPQIVKNVEIAIRQQEHIIDQQTKEKQENLVIGLMVRKFNDKVDSLAKLTVEQLSSKIKNMYMLELVEILNDMSRKTEKIRKDGYKRLSNIYKMLEANNLPAATWAAAAALDRMRKRYKTNERIISKSLTRLHLLKSIGQSK